MNKQKLRGIKRSLQTSPADYADLSEVLSVIDALLEDEPEEQEHEVYGAPGEHVYFRWWPDTDWEPGLIDLDGKTVIDANGEAWAGVETRSIKAFTHGMGGRAKQQERQFPPKGMPILIRGMSGYPWDVALSVGGGYAMKRLVYEDELGSPGTLNLDIFEWHYLPAPEPWPDEAKCWIGTSYGEYRFSGLELQVGEDLYDVIHVQHREDT
jgi:hypothetical protein